jgi:phage-related baseplate assembly protein
MSSFTAIDLSNIPAPDVVETLDFSAILAAMVADLQARDPAFTALVESDPAWKILEVAAYRELLLRQRINDASRAVMLAFATGADLEHLGALFGVTRKTLIAGNPSAIPPVEAVMEADADLRYRITLALEGLSTAGPEGAYLYHALKSEAVKHASVTGPPILSPGQVLVTLLGTTGSGAVTSTVISEVAAILNDEDVRPLTDQVTVQGATIVPYTIQATLYTYAGPDSAVVIQQAQTAAQAFADGQHRIGYDIPRSGIFAALHVAGVQRVELTQPAADITVNYAQAAYCTGLNITHAGVAE